MDSRIYIANSQVVFAYNRNLEIRKRVFEYEDSLKKFFKTPFKTIPIPDELDGNIPRFESESLNGNSKIQVSQIRTTFSTNYRENFRPNIKDVRTYISDRFSVLKDLSSQENLQFVALIMELGAVMEEDKLNDFIKTNTGVKAINDGTRDFSLLYSKEYKKDYFINIKCSKFTEDEVKVENGNLRLTGNKNHGISVVIDINTRLHYNIHKSFDSSLIELIEKETFDIIDLKNLEEFLNGNIQ